MDMSKLPVFNKIWQYVGAGNLIFDVSMKFYGATLFQLFVAFIIFVPGCGSVILLFSLFENYGKREGLL
jgi:hypothetical protein